MVEETPEVETVNGFNIPLRELTPEEADLDITWKRFRSFHYAAGEDFLDQTDEGNALIFGGWLLHKYPQHCVDILEICNDRYPSVLDFSDLEFLSYDEEKDIDLLYVDFAEFCNLTQALKKRVNQVLIQVTEHYNR